MVSKFSIVIIPALMIAMSAVAKADMLVTNVGSGALRDGYTNNSIYAGALGAEITVGANPVSVTALGYFDGPNSSGGAIGDGLLQSHEVGVFTVGSPGVIVPGLDLTVPAGGGTLVGDFRYVDLSTPVLLAANTSYIVAGQVTAADQGSGGDVFLDQSASQMLSSDFSATLQAQFTGPASGNGTFSNGVFAYPADGGSSNQMYLGPNFQYNVVPEPASLILLGVGVGVVSLLLAGRNSRGARLSRGIL